VHARERVVQTGEELPDKRAHCVLVVDDDPSIRKMIVAALKRDGYTFCEAPNGKEALDLMRKEHPNVVVLDLMMPILSGWDVLQARELEPELKQIPVIVISANRAPEVATAVDKGICAFLPKPFDIGALSALVRSCLPLPGARSATASDNAEAEAPAC
jgi:CheY-like chemotaxis protein